MSWFILASRGRLVDMVSSETGWKETERKCKWKETGNSWCRQEVMSSCTRCGLELQNKRGSDSDRMRLQQRFSLIPSYKHTSGDQRFNYSSLLSAWSPEELIRIWTSSSRLVVSAALSQSNLSLGPWHAADWGKVTKPFFSPKTITCFILKWGGKCLSALRVISPDTVCAVHTLDTRGQYPKILHVCPALQFKFINNVWIWMKLINLHLNSQNSNFTLLRILNASSVWRRFITCL